jgi:hypothetical protein
VASVTQNGVDIWLSVKGEKMKLDGNDFADAKYELLDELEEKYGGYPDSVEKVIDRFVEILIKKGI